MLAVNIGEQFKFGSGGVEQNFPTFGSLVSVILPNILVIAGVVFFFILLFGGFGVIMGAGGGNPQQTDKGKQAITTALVGFLVIFAAYWIVQIIGIITGTNLLQ